MRTSLALEVAPAHEGVVSIAHVQSECTAGALRALPDWVRTQAYQLLLGYLPPAKASWLATLRRRRSEYFRFLSDLAVDRFVPGERAPDKVLDQVYKDLFRASEADPNFYDCRAPWPKASVRHELLDRLETINRDFAYSAQRDRPPHGERFVDRQWHAMLRILYLYAMLNPSVGYVQGMHEILHVLLRAFFATRDTPLKDAPDDWAEVLAIGNTVEAEADAFWCFSLLIGELREVYDFGHGDATTLAAMRDLAEPLRAGARMPDNGMAHALHRFSAQLAAEDPTLATALRNTDLDPRLPYYSLRYLVCLYAAEFPWPAVLQIWDVLLAQGSLDAAPSPIEGPAPNEKIAFLVDVGCAMLMHVRGRLLDPPVPVPSPRRFAPRIPGGFDTPQSETPPDTFQQTLGVLQQYPEQDVVPILDAALTLNARRRAQQPLPRSADARRAPLGEPRRAQRNTSLQERLAATVQRSLNAPVRSATWAPESAPMRRGSSASERARPSLDRGAPHTPTKRLPPIDTDASPTTPLSSGRALFKRYTEALQDSNTAASVSKASTNLAAKALAWRAARDEPGSPTRAATRSAPPTDAPLLPIPTVVDSPNDRDAYRSIARTRAGLASAHTPESAHRRRFDPSAPSPATSEDDSFTQPLSSPSHLSLPSMRAAAKMGLLATPPTSDSSVVAPLASGDTPPGAANLSRRIPSGQRRSPRMVSGGSRRHRSHDTSPRTSDPVPAAVMPMLGPVEPTPEGGHTAEHLDQLLAELKTNEWVKD